MLEFLGEGVNLPKSPQSYVMVCGGWMNAVAKDPSVFEAALAIACKGGGTICPFGVFFPCFIVIFGLISAPNMTGRRFQVVYSHVWPNFDTKYDRAKVPPYNGNDPPPAPGSLKALFCFHPY